MDPVEFLRDYLTRDKDVPDKDTEEFLDLDYFEAGLIDSFGVINLVAEIEGAFGIRFGPSDMQSKDFRTVRGLGGIIQNLRAG